MSIKRYFDKVGHTTEYFHYDHQTDQYAIEKVQDVTPILDRAEQLRGLHKDKLVLPSKDGGDWQFCGTIPNIVLAQHKKDHPEDFGEDGMITSEAAIQLLNSYEYSKLRATHKKI